MFIYLFILAKNSSEMCIYSAVAILNKYTECTNHELIVSVTGSDPHIGMLLQVCSPQEWSQCEGTLMLGACSTSALQIVPVHEAKFVPPEEGLQWALCQPGIVTWHCHLPATEGGSRPGTGTSDGFLCC